MSIILKKEWDYDNFMGSQAWREIRMAKLRGASFECENCGARHNLQVHHLDYDNELGEEYSESLMVLCKDCHNYMHQDIECFESNRKAK